MSDDHDDDVTAISTDEGRGLPVDTDGDAARPRTTKGRTYSDTTRAAFKLAADKLKGQLDDGADHDDLEPAIQTDDKPSAAGAAPSGESAPAAALSAAPAAPSPVAQAADAIAAERLAQLDAREAKLNEREAQQRDHLGRFREDAADAVRSMIREAHGLDSDDAVKAYASDLITELSGQVLGLEVPEHIKARGERTKAERLIREHNASLRKREEETTKKEADLRTQDERRQTIHAVRTELAKTEVSAQYPWLIATEDGDPADIVYGVAEAISKQDPTWKPSLTDAAKRANDFYEKKARASYEKYKHLLNPAPPKPQKPAAQSPQDGPPGSRSRETLRNAEAAEAPARQPDSGKVLTNEDRRRASMKRFRASIPAD